jgi:hypothetical protein
MGMLQQLTGSCGQVALEILEGPFPRIPAQKSGAPECATRKPHIVHAQLCLLVRYIPEAELGVVVFDEHRLCPIHQIHGKRASPASID